MAAADNVAALATRVGVEIKAVRAEMTTNPRLPIPLTQTQYDALPGGPVPGQIYFITGA